MGMQADDEAQILRLDSEWNEAYLRGDRSPLAHILADDFTGLHVRGEPINPSTRPSTDDQSRRGSIATTTNGL
jgi:ketosteroid isomerase-like protein